MLMLLEMLLKNLIYILRDCSASTYRARDMLNTLVVLIADTDTLRATHRKTQKAYIID